MALGVDYVEQQCSLARALEVVGERWTMLILRDCFFGVRRFTDFQAHLNVSRAVLTQRLAGLVAAGVLERSPRGGRAEYLLTELGRALWPALYALTRWGEQQSGRGARRIYAHADCGTDLDAAGHCPRCGGPAPPPADLVVRPGPAYRPDHHPSPVGDAMSHPHRLLTPLLSETRPAEAGSTQPSSPRSAASITAKSAAGTSNRPRRNG